MHGRATFRRGHVLAAQLVWAAHGRKALGPSLQLPPRGAGGERGTETRDGRVVLACGMNPVRVRVCPRGSWSMSSTRWRVADCVGSGVLRRSQQGGLAYVARADATAHTRQRTCSPGTRRHPCADAPSLLLAQWAWTA